MTAQMPASPSVQRPVWSPPLHVTAVVNAASGEAGWAAPGQLIAVQGEGLPSDARVLIDGIAAPVLEATANEILAVVPYALNGRDWVSVVVEDEARSRRRSSSPVRVMMVEANPAFFTVNGRGCGQAIAENSDGASNSPSNSLAPGDFLTLYGTGEGLPAGETGSQHGRVPAEPWLLPVPKLPIRVFVSNEEAGVVYAGAAPGGAFGKLLMIIQVPRTLKPGCHEVTMQVGRFLSRAGVTVSLG